MRDIKLITLSTDFVSSIALNRKLENIIYFIHAKLNSRTRCYSSDKTKRMAAGVNHSSVKRIISTGDLCRAERC